MHRLPWWTHNSVIFATKKIYGWTYDFFALTCIVSIYDFHVSYQLLIWLDTGFECVYVCHVYTGMTFEVKTEADSNDITKHPHDGSTSTRPYLCTVCDKRFTRADHLKQHKQIHTGALLYSCAQCEKRFQTHVALSSHMNIHSSKYKCAECGKCFRSHQKVNSTQTNSFRRETVWMHGLQQTI